MAEFERPTPSHRACTSDGSTSLSERINIATRSIHGQLNRLIIVRLPLALPPHASGPSTYATGILHIAPIYIAFESLWQAILDLPCIPTELRCNADLDGCRRDCSNPSAEPLALVCSRTRTLLAHLRLPGLLRAPRLRADIQALTRISDLDIEDKFNRHLENSKLSAFVVHARNAVNSNPHVLLAYAWVFYMALFSGGRYLRATLAEAGGEGAKFWSPERSQECLDIADPAQIRRSNTPESEDDAASWSSTRSRRQIGNGGMAVIPGLEFFNFVGDADGEDIKVEFKKRLAEAEILLTSREKEHIVVEAEHIFNFMVEIVLELDKVVDPCTAALLPLHETGLLHSQSVRNEKVVENPLSRPHSKGGFASSLQCGAKNTRYLGSLWTKWLTSLLPMVLCIVLTSWYYGM